MSILHGNSNPSISHNKSQHPPTTYTYFTIHIPINTNLHINSFFLSLNFLLVRYKVFLHDVQTIQFAKIEQITNILTTINDRRILRSTIFFFGGLIPMICWLSRRTFCLGILAEWCSIWVYSLFILVLHGWNGIHCNGALLFLLYGSASHGLTARTRFCCSVGFSDWRFWLSGSA